MNELSPEKPAVGYKDRSTGLTVFGIMTLLLGALCALLVPLMFFGQMMAGKSSGASANFQTMIPGAVLYSVLAVALIWLGIGSIKARRWARALLLIFSWSWLIIGVIALAFMVIMLPQFTTAMQSAQPAGQPELPEAAKTMVMIFSLVFMSVIYLVLPAVWVFFYRSPHVKATCEARDPVPRWTDACPLPVLALSVWLAWSAPMMLMMPLAYHSVLPFFGVFLSGMPGTLGLLVLAFIWAWCARALYRLDGRGWWLLVLSFCAFTVSHVMTYSKHDVMELYVLMGYPEEMIEQMKKFAFITSDWMVWGAVAFVVPFLGYMLYVKKFFRKG